MKFKTSYFKGIKSGFPVLFGFIPVGIAYAIMAQQAGFSSFEIIVMSAMVFAGASQMMAVGMYTQGAGLLTITIATFILNLRHLIMSTCVVNKMTDGGIKSRLFSAFFITDESFAIFTTEKKEYSNLAYFLGIATVTYTSWVGGAIVGVIASHFLPPTLSASLGIALYSMFIALVVPGVKGNNTLILLVILTGITNFILGKFLPSNWALIFSTLFCAGIGTFFVDLKNEDKEEEK